jgi:acid stress chaperone HdeB
MTFMRWGLLVCALVASFQASAVVIDLSAMKCEEFLKSGKDEIGVIVIWLDGYYRDADDRVIIYTDKFVADSMKLGDYCTANPTVGLITAADKMFEK